MAISNIDLRVNSRHAVAGLKAAQRQSNLLTRSVKGLIKQMGPLAALFTGVTLVRNYFKGFNEAEKATQALRTLGVDARRLNNDLKALSIGLGGMYSATQLSTAAYDVASAGFTKAADAADVLRASALGARGGLSDLNTVGNAVTSVLNAYGKSAKESERLVDGFIQTQNDGKIILDQYAKYIGRLAPTASASGVSIEELNAAISTITAQGVPVQATFTGLNQALVSILKPSSEAEKLAHRLGIEFNETGLRSKGLAGLLAEVKAKTGGSTTALVKLFGSVDALKAVLPLVNDDLVGFNKNLENQQNALGTAAKASELMGQTLSNQFTDLINVIGNLVRVLDGALGPALKGILGYVKGIVLKTAEAVQLINDLTVGAGYMQLAGGAMDLTASKLLPGANFEKYGASKLLTAAEGINPMQAQSVDELNKMYSLVEKIANQAQRIRAGGTSQEVRDKIFSEWGRVREEINARQAELLALEGQNNSEIEGGNNGLKERLAILEEVKKALGGTNAVLSDSEQAWITITGIIRDGLVNAIQGAIEGTKTLGDVAASVFKSIANYMLQYGVTMGMESLGFKLPGRAAGGPVTGGKGYVVGERGPEIFVPGRSGTIIPNQGSGGESHVSVSVDASGSAVEGSTDKASQLGKMLGAAVQAELVRQKRPGGILA